MFHFQMALCPYTELSSPSEIYLEAARLHFTFGILLQHGPSPERLFYKEYSLPLSHVHFGRGSPGHTHSTNLIRTAWKLNLRRRKQPSAGPLPESYSLLKIPLFPLHPATHPLCPPSLWGPWATSLSSFLSRFPLRHMRARRFLIIVVVGAYHRVSGLAPGWPSIHLWWLSE